MAKEQYESPEERRERVLYEIGMDKFYRDLNQIGEPPKEHYINVARVSGPSRRIITNKRGRQATSPGKKDFS